MVRDILMIIFLALAAVYFFYAKKVKQHHAQGGGGKLVQWAASWTDKLTPSPSSAVSPDWSSVQADIVAALDDIYQEFTDEIARLQKELSSQVEQVREEIREELQVQMRRELGAHLEAVLSSVGTEAVTSVANDTVGPVAADSAPTGHDQSSGTDYHFAILDGLYQGKSPEQIASELDISTQEVYIVQKLLQAPNS